MRRRTKVFSRILFLSVLIILVSCSEQKTEWKGKIELEDGVEIVKNPKEPLYKENILTFEEDLVLGRSDADGVYAFSHIRDLAVDGDEYIYILDDKKAHVKVFDKKGKYLRTIGQKGQGPGDLDNPGLISIYKITNELMVFNGSQGISFFSRDGEFLKNRATNDSKRAFKIDSDSQGNILLNVVEKRDQKNPLNILKKLSPNMSPISEIASAPMSSPYDLLAAEPFWTIDEKDYVYYSYPIDYDICVYDPEGKLIRRITRDYDPVKISEEEKEKYLQQLRDLQLPPDIISKINIAGARSALWRFIVDEDSRIFVENWEKTKDDNRPIFDIFDSAGKYIAKIPIKGVPALFKKNKLYNIEEDEEGYQYVKRYKVSWNR
jgi:hypothetical protein